MFFCEEKRFCITHGFVSVKLMFQSVDGRVFFAFSIYFSSVFLGPNLMYYKENNEKTL